MEDRVKLKSMQSLWAESQLTGHNAAYLDELYDRYLEDPGQVEEHWRNFFDTLPQVDSRRPETSHSAIRDYFRDLTRRPDLRGRPAPQVAASLEEKQIRVLQLINAYRFRAHQIADTDPLNLRERPQIEELEPAFHGLSEADLDQVFDTGSLAGAEKASLREILRLLERTYARSIGAEYMHITETQEKRWLQQRLESCSGKPRFSDETRLRILDRLTAAEGLERYLHNRYVGQKRFSLEGGDSLIPILDEVIQRGGVRGVKEVVIGMAHRGRLNVLVNIMGKTPEELFQEFEGKAGRGSNGSGDVKYHLGFSSDIQTPGGPVHVNLAFNPSHLEIVDPVVEGSVRARQDRRNDQEGKAVVPVLIHGDAAFAGQGVVMETFNMSQSRGYSTKGTVHIVVNNQIGFTTSHQKDARSTLYCTDIAKMVNAPILHVNGNDPEAVLFVTQIALDYRMTYHKDVVIDLVCYRRHGHSEADEPTATQPLMYHAIKQKPTARKHYAQLLIDAGMIDGERPGRMLENYRDALDAGRSVVREMIPAEQSQYPHAVNWHPFIGQSCTADIKTAISAERLKSLWKGLSSLPEGFEVHPNVGKIMDNRRKMTAGALAIDWGYAETMAYASLVTEGYPVRLSGQDSGRGTFFHRHAVLNNQFDGTPYVPLRNIESDQANFLVINSLLSEEAVLAFEYGYATTDPGTLVIWEAQFGDFANNAQVVIDQFISAGEQKWNRLCGLVMFLPHGYEGQGPEHSSGRLERYLQLCAEQNMQVCVPTTPSQIFHLLRQQMLINSRKPLIVMTPKSLLRHRMAVSRLEDLTEGNFHAVIPEIDDHDPKAIHRVILCSGKVYYDLLDKRRENALDDVAIIRVERLYPFPETILRQILEHYPNVEHYIWCQEEPKNQGAWFSSQHHMYASLAFDCPLEYVGRPFSAAPAVGYNWLHLQQQHRLVAEALGLETA